VRDLLGVWFYWDCFIGGKELGMDLEAAKILIVDDDDDIRELLFDRLEFMGHDVSIARNGREGLERIEADKPDLVMLDIQMPELDGFGVLKGVAEKQLNTTIIMITANGTIQKAVLAMQEGAFDFLLKPFQPRDVERRVDRALVQVRLERENKRLLAELAEAKEQLIAEMQSELQVAHDIQMGLMPKESPQIEGLDLSGRCIPAKQVGGDFFQYFYQSGKLALTMADVSGHGMAAAIPVVLFNGALECQIYRGESIQTLFSELNRTLLRVLDDRTFVCFTMGEIDLGTRKLRLSNSGCPSPYYVRSSTGEVVELETDAYPLGVCAETDYEVREVQLQTDDYVVFCSDGIAEAENAAGEQFGYECTERAIRQACVEGLSAEAMIDHILEAVAAFSGDMPQGDDMTCVVVRV
jgi:phosphoserine phosphatase RsbU/P